MAYTMIGGTPDGRNSVGTILAVCILMVAGLWIGGVTGIVDLGEATERLDTSPVWQSGDEPIDTETQAPTSLSSLESSEQEHTAVIEQLIHERVNEIRNERGIDSIEHDDEIADVARAHSHDMYQRDYFDHLTPDDVSPGDRMAEADLFPGRCWAVGENLAYLTISGDITDEDRAEQVAELLVDGWMDSDGHRENLLDRDWGYQGIGVYHSGNEIYATQKFCSQNIS